MSEKPVHTILVGGVKAAVWLNRNGDGQTFFTTTIVRIYKDSEDNWRESNTFMPNQLPQLELATRKAYEFIQLGREPSRADHRNKSEEAQQQLPTEAAPSAQAQAPSESEEAVAAGAQGDAQLFTEKVTQQRGGRKSR